jgi:hypothetical protein
VSVVTTSCGVLFYFLAVVSFFSRHSPRPNTSCKYVSACVKKCYFTSQSVLFLLLQKMAIPQMMKRLVNRREPATTHSRKRKNPSLAERFLFSRPMFGRVGCAGGYVGETDCAWPFFIIIVLFLSLCRASCCRCRYAITDLLFVISSFLAYLRWVVVTKWKGKRERRKHC